MGTTMALVSLVVIIIVTSVKALSCPVDFSFVKDFFPSPCETGHSGTRAVPSSPSVDCCLAAFNTFGLAIAIHLRNSRIFELPNNSTVFSCYSSFEFALQKNGVQRFSVRPCPQFNASLFISSPSLCSGIQTVQDWQTRVGLTGMDSSCKGDLSSSAACEVCDSDVQKAISIASNLSSHNSSCFYFACLYAASVANDFGPSNPATAGCLLALKATPARSSKSHGSAKYAAIGAATVTFSGCILVIFSWLWWVRRRQLKHGKFVDRNKRLLSDSLHPNVGAIWYKFDNVKAATNNFSLSNVIGEGGYATVYKGLMQDGSQVAVKRIENCTPEGDTEFKHEVEVINSVRHRNLVALRGCCVASSTSFGHMRLLIYDFMPNGSLEHYLFSGKKPVLQWADRQRIALNIARGIAYLHTGVQPAIIHRDIKPNNVLLDEHLNAYVADFGLAKVAVEGMTHFTTRVAGTQGYLAPEYAMYGLLTEKNDVYSFGVLLLVLLSGRQALDVHGAYTLMTDWAWAEAKRSNVLGIVDKRIRAQGFDDLMKRYVLVGILCAHVHVAFRPTMPEVVKMLQGEADIPDIPDRPMPLMHDGVLSMDHLSSFFSNAGSMDLCSYKSEDLLR
ncbi:hypothetical protein L7F22_017399 [Adiantum nelumboides]|nr:hypothetical protein [Adiantum nelumboides]